MYSPGDILYLHSGTLSPSCLPNLTPHEADGALHSRIGEAKPGPPDGLSPKDAIVYQMRILHAYTPFTMAVVCRVRLIGVFASAMAVAPCIPLPLDINDSETTSSPLSPSSGEPETATVGPEYILKVYDRRCFENVREQCGSGEPYSEEEARAYQKYRQGTPAPYFTRDFWDMPGVSDEEDAEVDDGLFEAWLEEDARKTYRKELAVYNLLGDLQGKSIPKLFDTVSCNIPFRFDRTTSSAAEEDKEVEDEASELEPEAERRTGPGDFVDWNNVHGILIEYIRGPSLRSFIHSCMLSPNRHLRSELVSIADEAVAVTVEIGLHPVHNKDVRLDNMLVREWYVSTLDFDTPSTPSSPPEVLASAQTGLAEIEPKRSDTRDPAIASAETRCVAIDFGHARPRFADETDEQWRCAKNLDDEERMMTSSIRCELRDLFKQLFVQQGIVSEGADAEDALQERCLREQEALWNHQPRRLWYRKLSPEEYEEYLADSSWGQHPNSRD